jgi:hypothetical protein
MPLKSPKPSSPTPIDEARIAVIRAALRGGGAFPFSEDPRRGFECRIAKADFDRAVAIMADRGEIRFGMNGRGVTIQLRGTAA